jgi:regulator of protease activity HflC (stomatin/prohibitin superfamily)
MIRTHISRHEIGLVFRRGDLSRVLPPGRHFVPERVLSSTELLRCNTLDTRFVHPHLDLLLQDERVRAFLLVIDLGEDERALVWRDGRLFDFVGAGRFAYWQQPHALKVETFRLDELEFRHPQRDAVLAFAPARAQLAAVDVEPHERLLVRRGGEPVAEFGPGRHVFWPRAGLVRWQAIDLREQIADVSGQEMLTADKVTLRVNLMVGWRIVDPVAATTRVSEVRDSVYRQAQLALRAAIGGRELDRLRADKDVVANEIRAALLPAGASFGVEVTQVGIRDLVLPGEMKAILNQVIEAQKRAEANLIRRREETAAARSQANTARVLAEHPVLMRLKELEAIEAIVKGTKATFVLGGGQLGLGAAALAAGDGAEPGGAG